MRYSGTSGQTIKRFRTIQRWLTSQTTLYINRHQHYQGLLQPRNITTTK